MPDVWTTDPETLRRFLTHLNAKCGVEARILSPRDSEWTCHVDGPGWIGDVYIHYFTELLGQSPFIDLLVLSACVGIFFGLAWGRIFWRRHPA